MAPPSLTLATDYLMTFCVRFVFSTPLLTCFFHCLFPSSGNLGTGIVKQCRSLPPSRRPSSFPCFIFLLYVDLKSIIPVRKVEQHLLQSKLLMHSNFRFDPRTSPNSNFRIDPRTSPTPTPLPNYLEPRLCLVLRSNRCSYVPQKF
jgi:hypothetical protein